MRAGIQKHFDLAILISAEEYGTASHHAPAIVSGVFHLGLVAHLEPAAVENAVSLQHEDFIRGHRGAMGLEFTSLGAVYDEVYHFTPSF